MGNTDTQQINHLLMSLHILCFVEQISRRWETKVNNVLHLNYQAERNQTFIGITSYWNQ